MMTNNPWSLEAGDECLRIGGAAPRAWSFFWPGRVVIEPLTDGVVWSPRGETRPLPMGTKLVAPANAAHLRLDLAAGAVAKVRFSPAGEVAPVLGHVYLPEIVGADDAGSLSRARVIVPGHVARAYRHLVGTEDPCLTALAAAARVDRCYLVRSYHDVLGLPPYRHRVHLRVARARALLRAGRECTTVAHETGFCDQSHFTRCFKELTGAPPSVYARLAPSTIPIAA